MSEIKRVTTPLTEEAIKDLHAGDSVLLSGVIYTARDKAHKRLCDTLAAGKP
ncbi:MAG: fumarate hydratase C-terminal domain-containing protein, partial [Peptococcaceae bacterium]|nr:fumarate hydratase C-terminal domain-containing protein [Peptococcaceae bacterium]